MSHFLLIKSFNFVKTMKYGKIIFVFFMTSALLYNNFRVTLTYAYYYLDPVGFIEQLCENLDKPELECNGMCQLNKVTEADNSNERKIPDNIIDFKELLLYKTGIQNLSFLTEFLYSSHVEKEYRNLYSFLNHHEVFHPPKIHFLHITKLT